jgi:alpha-glucoside transport system substrate-binding protein
MRIRRVLIPLFAFALVAAACGDDDGDGDSTATTTEEGGGGGALENTGKVTLLSAGEPEETDAYQAIFDDMINSETDYDVEVVPAGDFEQQFQIQAEGGTLDVAAVPQPGAIPDLVDKGSIVALEDLGFDIGELNDTLGESFVALGEYKGKHYGVPTNINLKSMVWYPKDDFDAAGYEVPETWDDMIALSDKIVADGSTPWCIGFGSEGSTGWPATDWMEDIMLRTAGPDVYDQWVSHDIPFNDPAVKAAAERFGQILFTKGYVLGGAAATPDITFQDAPGPMFDDPPKCWLHRQASFINASFPEDAKAGVDYDWFPLPPIDQEGTLFAGELTVVGKNGNRPEVVDFIKRFIADDVQCEMGGVTASSRISPNVNVGEDCYANDNLAGASVVLTDALKGGTGRFDASDLMPAAVGSGSFWTGMIDYVKGGPSSLDGVLDKIEASWP